MSFVAHLNQWGFFQMTSFLFAMALVTLAMVLPVVAFFWRGERRKRRAEKEVKIASEKRVAEFRKRQEDIRRSAELTARAFHALRRATRLNKTAHLLRNGDNPNNVGPIVAVYDDRRMRSGIPFVFVRMGGVDTRWGRYNPPVLRFTVNVAKNMVYADHCSYDNDQCVVRKVADFDALLEDTCRYVSAYKYNRRLPDEMMN